MKTCTKCKLEKADEEFNFKYKDKGIRSGTCRQCNAEYKTQYYRDTKNAHKLRNDATNRRNIKYVQDYKSANPCIVCKEAEPICLDFHHVDPSEKTENVSSLLRKGSINAVKEEIAKCVMLCANCHRKLHAGVITL